MHLETYVNKVVLKNTHIQDRAHNYEAYEAKQYILELKHTFITKTHIHNFGYLNNTCQQQQCSIFFRLLSFNNSATYKHILLCNE